MRDIHPISTDQKAKLKLKERVREILLASTTHGIANIIRGRNLFIKLMWIFFLILSVSVGSYFTIDSILDYLKFDTITTIRVINEKQPKFPTVSFCAYPKMNYKTKIYEIVVQFEFEKQLEPNLSSVFENFTDPNNDQCFRFNSGKNIYGEEKEIISTKKSGKPNNLRIAFYLNVPSVNDFGELLINIHNHSTPPFDMENRGYWLKPGSVSYFQVDRVFTEQMEEPYNDCLKDVYEFKLNKTVINEMKVIKQSDKAYSQMDCFRLCSYWFALKESNCSCNSSLKNFEKNCIKSFFDNETDIYNCIDQYLNEFQRKNQIEKCLNFCPLECDSMSLSINNYIEMFPANGSISDKTKNDYSLDRFNSYEEVNKHYIVVYVFYGDLRYTLISEEPETETFNFISNIGGLLGLYLFIFLQISYFYNNNIN